MPKTIILTKIIIDEWIVNLNKENITVKFRISDDSDKSWEKMIAIFWRNIPPTFDGDGNPIPPPENWFEIPPSYIQTLVNLNNNVRTALENKFIS